MYCFLSILSNSVRAVAKIFHVLADQGEVGGQAIGLGPAKNALKQGLTDFNAWCI